jgi:hypothetical protein
MSKWEPLNMELRSSVISHLLRLEQSSTSAIRCILRMFNENSKTLGNKSSALSLKSKMDLLYDLEEINKKEYNHSLKLMEIRNQFAHNPDAISFESLDLINPDINKYLLRFEDEKSKKIKNREEKLKAIFSHLAMLVAGRVMIIDIDYSQGMEVQIRRHVNDIVVENIDEIWERVKKKNNIDSKEHTTSLIFGFNPLSPEFLYSDLRIEMLKYAQEKSKELDGNKLSKVFKPKESIEKGLG